MSPFDQARFLGSPISTRTTVPVNPEDTPLVKKGMRRLKRGQQMAQTSDTEDDMPAKVNAFRLMRQAAKKTNAEFDKSKSRAKDIVDEAAEESEDEYAGLGGASDEYSGSEDELDQQMINDNSGEVVDEKELAALNA
jgi:mediator of replication checkpoint protein 1